MAMFCATENKASENKPNKKTLSRRVIPLGITYKINPLFFKLIILAAPIMDKIRKIKKKNPMRTPAAKGSPILFRKRILA